MRGVDRLQVDELLDLDRAGPLRCGSGEFLVCEDYLLAIELVAVADLLPGDLAAGVATDAAVHYPTPSLRRTSWKCTA